MLRHDNISVDAKPEPASDPLQPQLEHSLAGCRREQRTTPVAAEGYEVGLAGLLKSLQSPRHRASLRPANSPLKPKDGLSGPPVLSGVGFTVPHPLKIAEGGATSFRIRAKKSTQGWASPPGLGSAFHPDINLFEFVLRRP